MTNFKTAINLVSDVVIEIAVVLAALTLLIVKSAQAPTAEPTVAAEPVAVAEPTVAVQPVAAEIPTVKRLTECLESTIATAKRVRKAKPAIAETPTEHYVQSPEAFARQLRYAPETVQDRVIPTRLTSQANLDEITAMLDTVPNRYETPDDWETVEADTSDYPTSKVLGYPAKFKATVA